MKLGKRNHLKKEKPAEEEIIWYKAVVAGSAVQLLIIHIICSLDLVD